MERPLVSVILASYNHEKFVEKSVRSIMAQKGVPFELLVIDDGSSDSSPQILQRLSRELGFSFRHRENKGFVPTLNELVSMAQGKYFCTFASDDKMAPGRLAAQCGFLESHPDKVACFGQILLMDAEGTLDKAPDPRYTRAVPEVTFEELFLGKKELHGCSEMIRLETFKEMGGYDSRFSFEDFPLWLKLSKKYGPLPVLPCICTHYRILKNSMHTNLEQMYSGILVILEDYRTEPLYPDAKKIWKANWFSALAFADKKSAWKKFPQLCSFSRPFLRRIPKLFIPQRFLKF